MTVCTNWSSRLAISTSLLSKRTFMVSCGALLNISTFVLEIGSTKAR